MAERPRAAIFKTDGINCDEETRYAFNKAGCEAEIIPIKEFKSKARKLSDFQIIIVPGGFSKGDDIAAGRILGQELKIYFSDELMEHVYGRKRIVVAICNGFQAILETGLPFGEITSLSKAKATLEKNDSGRFESRWVWVKNDDGEPFTLPVAHGEGKFVTDKETLKELEKNNQISLRYCTIDGSPTMDYPANPNGSQNSIAGIRDLTGRVISLMPHPERFVERYNHPQWHRLPKNIKIDGLEFIKKEIVKLASEV
jgi:phosphoribosylformylglycinamidine synthase subunit PurQ / glutaminase